MGEQLRAVVKSEGVKWTFEDEAGTQRAVLIGEYKDEWEGVLGRLPVKGSAHADFGGMVLVKRKVEREPGGLAMVNLRYESNDPSAQYGPDGAAGAVRRYDQEVIMTEEPLLTHDKYSELPPAELEALARFMNGERRTESGQELVDLITTAAGVDALGKIRQGQTTWISPGLEWVERAVIKRENLATEIDLTTVGKIFPPRGGAPADDNYNWLYLAGPARSREDGEWMDVEHRWRLSAFGGWNDLYTNPI